MGSRSNTPYSPADNSAPFMVLPEHVDGFIDVQTLADIHRYLIESESEEDIALAAWIDKNYLYEPRDKGGRKIRTTEGFGKLDTAYRRVRSLTNKAQDKWPFFDKNWKSMSTTTVRNNARGEASPGVFLPGHGEAHDPATKTSFDVPKVTSSAQLQVPFGTKQPGRQHVAQKSPNLCPLQPTSAPLPSKKEVQSEDLLESKAQTSPPQHQPDFESKRYLELGPEPETEAPQDLSGYTDSSVSSEKQVSNQTEPAIERESDNIRASLEVSTTKTINPKEVHDASEDATELELEPLRDAGGGKVRGPNGRYLPKKKFSSASAKLHRTSGGAWKKHLMKATSDEAIPKATEQAGLDSPSTTDVEEMIVDIQTPSSSVPENGGLPLNGIDVNIDLDVGSDAPASMIVDTDDDSNDRAASGPIDYVESGTTTSDEPISAYLLAAEADPVLSNLDKLPPNSKFRPTKRKSEPIVQSGPRKRGRPRKTQVADDEQDANQDANQETKEKQQLYTMERPATEDEETPKMSTRRTTRRFTTSDVATDDLASTARLSRRKGKSIGDKRKSAVNGNESNVSKEHATAGHEICAPAPSVSKPSPLSPAKGRALRSSEPQPSYVTPSVRSQFQVSDADLLNIGLNITRSPAPQLQLKPASMEAIPDGNANATEDCTSAAQPETGPQNGTTDGSPSLTTPAQTSTQVPTHIPGRIEYFARVHTYDGTVEVPISTDKLDNEEAKLITKYAEWKSHKKGMHIPFDQFREIFGIMRD